MELRRICRLGYREGNTNDGRFTVEEEIQIFGQCGKCSSKIINLETMATVELLDNTINSSASMKSVPPRYLKSCSRRICSVDCSSFYQ